MGKPAVSVAKGDERFGADGARHRVVHKAVGADGQVTIAYDVLRPSGGTNLQFETTAREADTDFTTPTTVSADEDQPA